MSISLFGNNYKQT